MLNCLILAAGKGTRMKSALPKPMHLIANRPMVQHCLAAVNALNPADVAVVIAPDMAVMEKTIALAKVAYQAEAKGTGHAVISGLPAFGESRADVLVLFGDTPLVTPQTLQKLIERRQAADHPAIVVGGMTPPNATGYGRLVVQNNTLEAIVEEADATEEQRKIKLCNGGVILFDGALLSTWLKALEPNNAKGEYYLTDCIKIARQQGHRCAVAEIPYEDVLGVNSRADQAVVETLMQRRLRAKAMASGVTFMQPESTYLSYDTLFGQDVTVEPNVYFGIGVDIADNVLVRAHSHLEECVIASEAIIGPFARVRGSSRIDAGARVGNFVEIKNTHIHAGAKALHLSYLGDAMVGAHANIGAGTITCNYNGFVKKHTEIGAGAFIGSNSALVAPIKIGADALIGAGSVVTQDVPDDALAIERSPLKIAPQCGMKSRRKRRQ